MWAHGGFGAVLLATAAVAGCQASILPGNDAGPAGTCGDGTIDTARGEVCDDGANDALGGGCLPGCTSEDRTDEIFAADILDISIVIDEQDWESLRTQRKTRHGIFGTPDCRTREIVNPYTYYRADVTIDGETIERAGVRKKGHLGSQSTLKPSLKLDLDEFSSTGSYKTATRLALNNSKSDPAYARTCLAYQVFAAAGIPAPRCTYAHVTVNGADMGVYVATEEMKPAFLRRHFAEPGGNLYEGTACDFRPEFFGGFEQETNEGSDPSRADLQAVFDIVLDADDAELEAMLATVIDLDGFYRFWAVESLIWHRDGYSGNANNYFMYADPGDGGRFRFLPWGPDSAFKADNRDAVPDSVLAFGSIAYRLYLHPPARDRFYTELQSLLDDVWDAAALASEVDRVAGVIGPFLPGDEVDSVPAAAEEMKTVIAERQSVIEGALSDGPPEWTSGMRSLPCWTQLGSASATFSTTFGTLSDNIWDSGSSTLTLDGVAVPLARSGARAGLLGNGLERVQLQMDTADDRRFTLTLTFPSPKYFDPLGVVGTHELIAPPAPMSVVERDISVSPSVVVRRFEIGEGQLTFTNVGTSNGTPVTGTLEGTRFERVP